MRFIITVLLCIVSHTFFGQLINDPRIRYYVEVDGVDWDIWAGEDDPEGTWRVRTKFGSQWPNNSANEADYVGTPCVTHQSYAFTEGLGVELRSGIGAFNTTVYYNVLAYENDEAAWCTLHAGDSFVHSGRGTIDFKNRTTAQSAFHTYPWHDIQVRGWSDIRMRQLWSLYDGQWWVSSGLAFGFLEEGDNVSHSNTTNYTIYKGVHYGSENTFTQDSSNVFGAPAQDATDAYYRLDLNTAKNLTISTSATSFNHYIHLMNKKDGVFTHIASANGSSPLLEESLSSGIYYVIFEGEGSSLGNFTLHVAVDSAGISGGEITHPSPYIKEGCSILTPISTSVAPTTTFGGDFTYSWEYKSSNSSQSTWAPISGATNETLTADELGVVTEDIDIRRIAHSDGLSSRSNVLSFLIKSISSSGYDGTIAGRVTGPDQVSPVEGAKIYAISDAEGECQTHIDSAQTNSTGFYSLSNLYYEDPSRGANFKVYARYLDHGFDPDTIEVINLNSFATRSGVNFVDTSTVYLSGRVFQKDSLMTDCPLANVNFYRDGFLEPVISGEDGTYQLAITPGTYDFNAEFLNGAHTFSPESYANVDVSTDSTGFDYESTTRHIISGSIMACGGFCYGGVELRLVDDFGCFDYLLETDACGNFSTSLPARNYRLEVTSTDIGLAQGYDATRISSYFASLGDIYADLSMADTLFNFTFEQPPLVSLRTHTDSTGIQPISGCTQDTVLAQGEVTRLVFDVTEAFTAGCPLDTGIMVLIDEISGRDTTYVAISGGEAFYEVVPDTPYLFPFEPYQHLEFYAMSLDSQMVSPSQTIRAIVTGFRARNAQFTTVSPEIPFLILRDPPGDESHAFFEESHTTDFNMNFSAQYGGSVTTWGKAKIGAQFEAGVLGFSTESEAWGEVGSSATVSASNATATDVTVSVTNSVSHMTEDGENPAFLFENGDIYVGAAMNLVFAKADVLFFDEETCQDTQIVELIMGQDGFDTQFTHTESHIRDFLIPDLERVKDLAPADSVVWYQNQIDMWQQTLARNSQLKQMALPSDSYPDNITFSAGSNETYTTSNATTTSIAYEFALEVDTEFSSEIGFEVAGSGASGGVRSNFRVEIGGGTTDTELRSRTTSFTLKDGGDEPGDSYTVDIKECPVYGTAVFDLVSATTSCPYVPNTLKRDQPLLIIPNPVRIDADPDGVESFFLEIYNLSESEEERSYVLDFIDGTNPNLATMNPSYEGDNTSTTFSVPYTGTNGTPHIQRIDITRSNNEFSYENLTFVVYANCDAQGPINFDPATSSVATISIYYQSPCSDIDISEPELETSWLVNSNDEHQLPIVISDYNSAQLNDVLVQYTEQGSHNWSTLMTLLPSDLTPITTSVNLDFSDINDGDYDIRLLLNCSNGYTSSQRRSGVIDRTPPSVFGTPQPIDDIYDISENDEISVSFEESIDCANAMILLTDMETLEVIPATLSCDESKAIVTPNVNLETRGPAIYRASIFTLEDLNGNSKEDYHWAFVVGDYIFDPDCSPLLLSNNNVDLDAISQSVYYSEEITTDGTVQDASTIGVVSELGVNVEEGFTIENGGVFEANIGDCPND